MKNIAIILSALIITVLSGCGASHKNNWARTSAAIQVDAFPGSSPYLTKDSKGNPVLSWVRSVDDSTHVFCYAVSSDNGKTFGKTIVVPGSDNIHPHGENLPKIIFKPSGEIITMWGASNPNPKNKYSGVVFFAQSFDEGLTWTSPKTFVKDTASFDQRYYDVALLANGEAAVIWLDNRKTSKKEGSSLYFACTNGRNGFQDERRITESCCQCCRTDLFIDSKSGIHVLYRGIIQDSIRDMLHVVSLDNGKTFSSPKRISDDNWVLKGCPHTGPAMTENKQGLHFAWFTGGSNKGCYYTNSTDNGKKFAPRNNISGLGSHPQICAFPDGGLIVTWDETVELNDKYYKKIGIQKRTAEGIAQVKTYITPDTLTATYPVVSTLQSEKALVAYSIKKGKEEFIEYRVVSY